jgi:hypothetical protein
MLVISKLNVNLHTQNKTIINKRLYCVYTFLELIKESREATL